MSNMSKISEELSKAYNVKTSLELAHKSMKAFEGIDQLAKSLVPQPVIRGLLADVKPIPIPSMTAHTVMLKNLLRESQFTSSFMGNKDILAAFAKQFEHTRTQALGFASISTAVQSLFKSHAKSFEGIATQLGGMNSIGNMLAEFSKANRTWNIASFGIADTLKKFGLLAIQDIQVTKLFDAPIAYTSFVQRNSEILAGKPPPYLAVRIKSSMNLAKEQLLKNTRVLTGFIRSPIEDDGVDIQRELSAPFVQQEELIAYYDSTDDTDTKAMTKVSLSAQTVARARQILKLVSLCNEAGKTSSAGIEIFKPTTKLLNVFSDLPWISSTDEFRFGDLIDCFYFIFYEGAGKDNLRFLEANGGPLSCGECDLIWCIKHLRNKWSRHDADHGKDQDIKKSWAELAAKFRWLGLAQHPTTARHFQKLHFKLLILAEEFLKNILYKLNLKQ